MKKRVDGFMQLMDEDYKKKRYPNGYFNAIVKGNSSMTAGYVLFSVSVLLSLPFIFLGIRSITWGSSYLIADCVFIGIGILLIVLGIISVRLSKKLQGRSRQDWIQKLSKINRYSIEEAEEFDQQLQTGDAYLLTLKGKCDKRNENIVTADYILISGAIFKQSDLKALCLYNLKAITGVGNNIKHTNTLQVGVISSRNRVWLESDEKRGKSFIAMLKEKYPALETKDGSILKDTEFDALVKKYINPR